MNLIKKLFVQSMIISTSILFLNGINMVIQHLAGNDLSLQWYHPVTIILTAILCALPTILLRDSDQWDRKTFWRRVPLHCLSLYAVVAGAAGLSRGKAQELIRNEKVFVNGKCSISGSRELKRQDVLTIRGFGKMIYDGVTGVSRKGRLYITVRRYV